MRTLTYYVASTLDGFIAGPDGGDPSTEDFMAVTPDLVEFIATHYPETLPGPARDAMGLTEPGRVFDTVVEGRRSYEIGLAAGIDDAYPHLRHLVVSTTLGEAPAAAVEVVAGDPLARVRELKAEDGLGIWLVGGGRLAHTLLPRSTDSSSSSTPRWSARGSRSSTGASRPRSSRRSTSPRCPVGCR